MFRIIHWILAWSLAIGVSSAFADLIVDMARAAVHAHQNAQLSYAKFTKALLEAKPRPKKNKAVESRRRTKTNSKELFLCRPLLGCYSLPCRGPDWSRSNLRRSQ